MSKLFHLLSFIFYLSSFSSAQNPASVPLNNSIYPFLDRMETLGHVTHLLDGVKPYNRGRIAEILNTLNNTRDNLTSIDRRKLDDYLLNFRFEIDNSIKHELIPENQDWYSTLYSWDNFSKDFMRAIMQRYPEEENHTILWEKDSSNFYFDYQQYFSLDSKSDGDSRNANEQSYIFRGTIDNNFAYYVNISLQAVRGSKGYRELDPVIKGTFSQESESGNLIHVDRTGGELAWHTRYMDINFAQQELLWGHGESGKLILSNYAEQYPYFQISKNWGWGQFTAMHGKLISFQNDTLSDGTFIYNDQTRLYPDKWVAAHRLEFSPWTRFTIGLNEVFIYGNRYADWAYLIPFNFYRAVQHKLRDRDNATISLDFEYVPLNRLKLYTTIFLDEMKFEELGTNWWGNKHAIQAGLHITDPFGLENLELRVEYAAIMPWVYTHKYMVNRYESDKRSLGHWAGPNSEVMYFDLKKDFHARFYAGIKGLSFKKGYNYPDQNIGGELLVGRGSGGFSQPEKETRSFLEGVLSKETTMELYAQYEIFNDLFLSASYIWINSENDGLKAEGLNELHFQFLFNY
jgi:hypothetical protein